MTKIGYVDNDIDTYLSSFLSNLADFEYEDIKVTCDDTFETIIQKIIEYNCNIVILDSKLYNDSNVKTKITGQELELVLANRLPYIFSVVISQNEDVNQLNYLKKYTSSNCRNNYEKSNEYYQNHLLPILKFAKNKTERFLICFKNELSKEDGFDKMRLENIEALLKGENKVDLTKADIDKIVELLGEIKEYGGK